MIYLPGDKFYTNTRDSYGKDIEQNAGISRARALSTTLPENIRHKDAKALELRPQLSAPSSYCPVKGDIVIAFVTRRLFENRLLVDIKCPQDAILLPLKTKHNMVQPNGVILAQVTQVGSHTSDASFFAPKPPYCLSTTTPNFCILQLDKLHASHLPQNEQVLGELAMSSKSCVLNIPVHVAFILQDERCMLWKMLGTIVKYEVAIGVNGRIWISSDSTQKTAYIVAFFMQCFSDGFSQIEQNLLKLKDNIANLLLN